MKQDQAIRTIKELLAQHEKERVIVIGTTCTGKSTLLKEIHGADMDTLVFPKLTKEESDYVCQTPWTSEIGKTMTQFVKERVTVNPGTPVFGTVVLDCDFIVHLKLSDDLLKERITFREVSFEDAVHMQEHIEKEIVASKTPHTTITIGNT